MSGYHEPNCATTILNPRQITAAAGDPQAQGRIVYVSDDRKVSHGVWESTPGTFEMSFANDDSGLVLAGEAIAHFADGTTWRLTEGTLYTFKAGTSIRLEIIRTWRKVFFNYHPGGTDLKEGF
jgi:uncharacterized cupin superfamily protein